MGGMQNGLLLAALLFASASSISAHITETMTITLVRCCRLFNESYELRTLSRSVPHAGW